MTNRRTTAARFAGTALIGGIAAGALMALAVPTTMKNQAGEGWRDLIREPEIARDGWDAIPFEAGPQDLTPVSWASASQEYSATWSQTWVEPEPASDVYALQDDGGDVALVAEPLPAELLAASTEGPEAPSEQADAAADAADAAREAAADVRAVQNGAMPPVPDGQSDAAAGTNVDVS